jgi:hypothetical protein
VRYSIFRDAAGIVIEFLGQVNIVSHAFHLSVWGGEVHVRWRAPLGTGEHNCHIEYLSAQPQDASYAGWDSYYIVRGNVGTGFDRWTTLDWGIGRTARNPYPKAFEERFTEEMADGQRRLL